MAVLFEFHRLRFRLLALERIAFPVGKAGNVLRGAFGSVLRKQWCCPQCSGAGNCLLSGECPYATIFEPRAGGRFTNRPRPFVLRADHLDGRTIPHGDIFEFEMNIFDLAPATSEHIVKAFAAIEQEGLGARRRRAGLLDVEKQKNSLVLTPNDSEVSRVQVDFKTPTELKNKNEIAERPEFPILFARISERLNALQTFYGTEPLEAIPACAVRMTECTIVQSQVERRSSKTGQRHRIGGFTGAAIYEGDLRECLPLLRAAEFTGVGRHTAWGNGRLVVTVI